MAWAKSNLARDTKLGRRVALKMVRHGRLPSDRKAVDRFLEEARITASFNHPHIVTVYGVGEHQGSPYLALEYVEGQTLRQRMNEERLAAKEAMRIGLAIAQALAEAHRSRILHRDLKPENVMMGRDGRLRVLDLGLAKLLAESSAGAMASTMAAHLALKGAVAKGAVAVDEVAGDVTIADAGPSDSSDDSGSRSQRSALVGTPFYIAPEGWRGDRVSEAADLWALGVVLYELLSGKRPYQETPPQMFPYVVATAVAVPAVKGPGIPEELAQLVAQCLDKDSEKRPTADQVAERLGDLLGRRFFEGTTSPFRGLSAFNERHSDMFFGRNDEVAAFVEQLREQPVLTVVGPSGAGKSSFVHAGVVPRLREHGSWLVFRLRPGNDPFRVLASCLSREAAKIVGDTDPSTRSLEMRIVAADQAGLAATATGDADARLAASLVEQPLLLNVKLHELAEKSNKKVLLVVDQFEEVFTLTSDEGARRRFVEAVCRAEEYARGPVRVVVTIRDDFLGHIAEDAERGPAFERIVVLRRPSTRMLEQMITLPLQSMGYRFDDPALVGEMVASVRGEPACLPLLQFAGQMLWERRDIGKQLVLRSEYQAMGGVGGALADYADGALAGMSPEQVRVARELLVRLVTPEGTRRVVPVADTRKNLGTEAQAVLGMLAHARLVTLRKGVGENQVGTVVELTHESLIRSWRRFARWLEESKEERVFLSEIGRAAELWHQRGQRDDEVWQGDALVDARRKLARHQRLAADVPEQVAQFVQAGLRREQRQRRSRRVFVAGIMAFLATVAVVSLWRERETRVQKERAELREAEARTQRAEAQRVGARAAFVRGD
ncbi:MAG: serine/threonine-protein kinase, partial [Pseudomonadota bacterium]